MNGSFTFSAETKCMEKKISKWREASYPQIWFLMLEAFGHWWKLVRRAKRLSPMPVSHLCQEKREPELIFLWQRSKQCIFEGLSQFMAKKLKSQRFNHSLFAEHVSKEPYSLFYFILPCLWVVLFYSPGLQTVSLFLIKS
mgnify:CR=1 FL=1